MKNRIEDLRNHLFATLEALQDADKPMDIERAKTIAGVAQVLINSAKVEVDLVNAIGEAARSEFFGSARPELMQIESPLHRVK